MKIVFVSNYYNHHQAPFAKEMDKLTHHKFRFIETVPMKEERKQMGWGMESKPEYVLQSYSDKASYSQCRKLIDEADTVIWGSCPFRMIRPRLRRGKLTFAYSERIFKEGYHGIAYWGRVLKYFCRLAPYQKNHYLLCASAYAAGDYARIGLFRGKALKWGYFPETRIYNLTELFERKKANSRPVILWVARFIEWKHPEVAVHLAERLKQAGYAFDLNMIGGGEIEGQIRDVIREKKLDDCVHMLGTMSPEDVRGHMEGANIFLFTSDHNEGWGAVLNEAMNSGCAVVASDQLGSVHFLIAKGENGTIYRNGNLDDLTIKAEGLIDNQAFCKQIGIEAYRTIIEKWNAEVGSSRLIEIVDRQQMNTIKLFHNGICSEAVPYDQP